MIQVINRRCLIIIILLLFISCKENISKNNTIVKPPKKTNIQGVWNCSKTEKDKRFTTSYGDLYAQEFKLNSKFRIKNDSIYIGECQEEIFKYKYATKQKKFGNESVFIIKAKNLDSISIISTYENKTNSCIPLDNLTFYLTQKNELIIHDRGYFFTFTKFNKKDKFNREGGLCSNIGLPGNNRNYWDVECKLKTNELHEAYEVFKQKYPYGSKNLKNELPKQNYIDNKNNITYTVKNNSIIIQKSVPSGIIYIELKQLNKFYQLKYEMRFPGD